jgi:phosphotriesterase-related protein
MHIMTVLGPIPPEQLGTTLPHEHLIFDGSSRPDLPAPDSALARTILEGPVDINVLGLLRRNAFAVRDNLRLNDLDLMIREVRDFKRAGGNSLVELTPIGVGRDAKALRAVAVETGLNIIASTAYYTRILHPPHLADATLEEIAQTFVRELTTGIDQTGIRAGIIGEIGLSSPIDPIEEKVLRAAGRAHSETGAAINLHLSWGLEALPALAILKEMGVAPSRVALSHMDSQLDSSYHMAIADTGAFVEFDCFGIEWHFDRTDTYAPWDPERVQLLVRMVEAGYAGQMLLSHDIFTKMQLKRYGGWGYDHLLLNLCPRFRKAGITDEQIHTMMVENPRKLLTIG